VDTLKSLRDAGVHVALATDNVPTSLFHPIWHAVARLGRASNRAIAPSQKLSREPVKLADMAVLSDDPLTCAVNARR
jgi:predicted amidohydrolase YtcJ